MITDYCSTGLLLSTQ